MTDEVARIARQFFGVDEKLKILAISSDGAKAYAVYDGERLVVTHVLMSSQGHQNPEVINEVFAKKARGFACVIEGKNEYLARQAIQFPFDDANQTEAMLSNALDWYCFMLEIGNILVEPGCRPHLIAPSDENLKRIRLAEGRMTYSVDWAALTGGQRTILLCVIGIGFELVREWHIESIIRRRSLAEPHQAFVRALSLRWPEKVSSVEPPAEIIIPRIRWRRRGLRFGGLTPDEAPRFHLIGGAAPGAFKAEPAVPDESGEVSDSSGPTHIGPIRTRTGMGAGSAGSDVHCLPFGW